MRGDGSSVSNLELAWEKRGGGVEISPDQHTPNLAVVIQEFPNHSCRVSGNTVASPITRRRKRVVESHNGDASAAPLLHVEYQNSIL